MHLLTTSLLLLIILVEAKAEKPKPAPKAPEPVKELSLEEEAIMMVSTHFASSYFLQQRCDSITL
jgi:hypothetical protein